MEDSYKERLSTLSMLAKIILADGHSNNEELQFYIRIAKLLGVSEEEYTRIINGDHTFDPPVKEYKRIVLFHNLLLLAYADKIIDEKEIQVCYELGLRLGLNSEAVRDILEKLKVQPQSGIDPFRIERVFKRYYN